MMFQEFEAAVSTLLNSPPIHDLPGTPRMADLYCGIGGASLAAKNLGIDVVYAHEPDDEARRVYEKNIGIHPDRKINGGTIVKTPAFDLLYVCLRELPNGVEDVEYGKGTLFPKALRYVYARRPLGVVVEAPEGLNELAGGRVLMSMGLQLVKMGYGATHNVLSALSFDAPLDERRSFLVGLRQGKYVWPDECHGESALPTELIDDDQAAELLCYFGFGAGWVSEREDANRMLNYATPVVMAKAVLERLVYSLRQ